MINLATMDVLTFILMFYIICIVKLGFFCVKFLVRKTDRRLHDRKWTGVSICQPQTDEIRMKWTSIWVMHHVC